MKSEPFKIYIHHLKKGEIEIIDYLLPSDFLDVEKGDELSFVEEVAVKGTAYIAEETLILHLDIETLGFLPCAICNQKTAFPIQIKSFYHAEPLEKIPSGFFEIEKLLRENILLHVPMVVECGGGNCPQRKQMESYLKKKKTGEILND